MLSWKRRPWSCSFSPSWRRLVPPWQLPRSSRRPPTASPRASCASRPSRPAHPWHGWRRRERRGGRRRKTTGRFTGELVAAAGVMHWRWLGQPWQMDNSRRQRVLRAAVVGCVHLAPTSTVRYDGFEASCSNSHGLPLVSNHTLALRFFLAAGSCPCAVHSRTTCSACAPTRSSPCCSAARRRAAAAAAPAWHPPCSSSRMRCSR
jgi:hypothetical protein